MNKVIFFHCRKVLKIQNLRGYRIINKKITSQQLKLNERERRGTVWSMTSSQDAGLRGLTAPWPATATILTGGAGDCSAITAENTVVRGRKRGWVWVGGSDGKGRKEWVWRWKGKVKALTDKAFWRNLKLNFSTYFRDILDSLSVLQNHSISSL